MKWAWTTSTARLRQCRAMARAARGSGTHAGVGQVGHIDAACPQVRGEGRRPLAQQDEGEVEGPSVQALGHPLEGDPADRLGDDVRTRMGRRERVILLDSTIAVPADRARPSIVRRSRAESIGGHRDAITDRGPGLPAGLGPFGRAHRGRCTPPKQLISSPVGHPERMN